MLRTRVTTSDRTDAIAGQIVVARVANVGRTAHKLRDGWADRAPRDTDEYAESIGVYGPGSTEGFTGAFVAADATNQRGAEYPVWVEYGDRFRPAQPAARPAADAVRDSFIGSFVGLLR